MTEHPNKAVPHSFALKGEGARLVAPSAARNAEPICDLLVSVAPPAGQALELASGTGQHVARFAARLPHLHWQPTEIDAARRASIDQYAADTGLANIAPAISLNVAARGWGADHAGRALIVVSNLLHLISDEDVQTLIHEAAGALKPGGRLVIYGPFKRGGVLTSEGDAAFHAGLIAGDPLIGYKDDLDVVNSLQRVGLDKVEITEMPANNLALVAGK